MKEGIKDFGFDNIKSSKKEKKDIVFIKDVGFNDIGTIQLKWYSCNANLLQIALYRIDCDDVQIIEIQDVSEKSMFFIMKTIKETIQNHNFANHWIGCDEYRHL